jgi:CMP-N,N'-diacetyllegionaminic acid synthase
LTDTACVQDGSGITLAIIPARGGSCALPGKHLRRLAGLPLIAHTIRAARAAGLVEHVLVTTDDPAIRRVALTEGADAPFLRPSELSTDDAPTPPVILHAVRWFEQHRSDPVSVVVTLQPTSPLRGPDQIDAALRLLDDPAVDSVVTVAETGLPVSVLGMVRSGRWQALAPGETARRQASASAVRLTGGIYACRRSVLTARQVVGAAPTALVVDPETAIDVDTEEDLHAARAAMRRRAR